MRNPTWTRDELILSLDFYMRHKPSFPGKTSTEIQEFSGLLNRMGAKTSGDRDEKYRNTNGTYMKLMNFRRFDPDHEGGGLQRGGKDEEIVWNLFADNPVRLRQTAKTIIEFVDVPRDKVALRGIENDEFEEDALEGRVLTREHRYRERDATLIKRKKDKHAAEHGQVSCAACGFDFYDSYGERGEGFIECHHTKPVSELRPGERTKLSDLVLLCSNCHRMIHRRRPWLQIEELRALLQK
jgi:5-methylcytosine-specific restriction protein A